MFNKRLLQEFPENKKRVIGMVLTQWIMLIANVILMLQTAEFINYLMTGANVQQGFMRKVCQLVVTLVIVLLVRGVMSYLNSKLSFEASTQVKTKLRTKIYNKLMTLGGSYKEEFQTSEVVQLSTEGVEQLEIYFGKYIPQFFYSMLAPVTLFVIVGTMSLKVAIVLLICVPLIPVSIVAVQKFAKKMLAKYWGTYTQMGDSFLECLQGLTTLKIYNADERYARKMDEEAEIFRKVTMKVLIMQLNSISIMDLVAYGGAALGVILGVVEYQATNITLVECFFIIMISVEFFLPLRLLGSFFHIAMNGNAAADKIFNLLDLSIMENNKTVTDSIGDINLITMEKVVFSYEKDQEVFKNISLSVENGLTALVGESGCGKSTIASLLMQEHRLHSGEIRIDNTKISEINRDTLYKNITRIRHDSYLFAGTIRENLLMGKEDATEEELKNALKQVQLLDFVNENGGLEYEIKEKASNLSGGQKQRLAMARALLHNSKVYIFDEATSNVDVESENAIMEVVYNLAKTKIVILISHRLANVVAADKIYAMQDGMVIEQGTHKELIEQKGFYASLYNKQHLLENIGKEGLVNAAE